MIYVDAHVHLRDFRQEHKETIKHGLEVARDCGVAMVFDMPNASPEVMSAEVARQRIQRAKEANVQGVRYGVYMGLTKDPVQIRGAVEAHRTLFPDVVGIKLYAGNSTQNLGIINIEDQLVVFETLADAGYRGVLAIHAEKESCMNQSSWNYQNPVSHCHARPAEAEIASVQDMLALAEMTKFQGKLHIAHISTPKAVELVIDARRSGMDVSSGVCPHHFVYDWNQMFNKDGLLWKMNPPLRAPGDPQLMLEYLRVGAIDWVESDHAPHTLADKTDPNQKNPFASGIPGLPWWDTFVAYLRSNDFTEDRIREVTSEAVMRRFEIEAPRQEYRRKDRRGDYPFNPYLPLEQRLFS